MVPWQPGCGHGPPCLPIVGGGVVGGGTVAGWCGGVVIIWPGSREPREPARPGRLACGLLGLAAGRGGLALGRGELATGCGVLATGCELGGIPQ